MREAKGRIIRNSGAAGNPRTAGPVTGMPPQGPSLSGPAWSCRGSASVVSNQAMRLLRQM